MSPQKETAVPGEAQACSRACSPLTAQAACENSSHVHTIPAKPGAAVVAQGERPRATQALSLGDREWLGQAPQCYSPSSGTLDLGRSGAASLSQLHRLAFAHMRDKMPTNMTEVHQAPGRELPGNALTCRLRHRAGRSPRSLQVVWVLGRRRDYI